jgi:lipopolysaccharide export system protein LptC
MMSFAQGSPDMTRRSSVDEALAQPISKRTVRTDRDWTARTRDTALNALRYSRFVALMKRALPGAAGVLIAIVLIYALLPRQSDKLSFAYGQLGHIQGDLTMSKPRLNGTDQKGNPFVVTADTATQIGRSMHRAKLKNVEADLALDKGRWLNANAADGLVDMDKGSLALGGGISVFTDDGYEMHTARADIDLRKGNIHGPVPVNGQGPSGTFRADTFDASRGDNQLQLHGNVRMLISPPPAKPK